MYRPQFAAILALVSLVSASIVHPEGWQRSTQAEGAVAKAHLRARGSASFRARQTDPLDAAEECAEAVATKQEACIEACGIDASCIKDW